MGGATTRRPSVFFTALGGSLKSFVVGMKKLLLFYPRTSVCIWSYVLHCFADFLQVNPMGGKGKKGKSQAGQIPASARHHHVAVPGETHVSLVKYLEEHQPEVITKQPPGQSQSHPAPAPEQLSENTSLLMFSIIDMLDDHVNEGICLEELKMENIVVLSNGCPQLIGVKLLERKQMASLKQFKAAVAENYVSLARIFRRLILAKVSCTPADVSHLIFLMENCAWEMRFLINYHAAIVRPANSLTLYIRLYNYVWDILRQKDPDGFSYVLDNMEFDLLWRTLLSHNRHLQGYYQNTSYANTLAPGTDAFMLKERRLVARFNRNGPSHPLELALDIDPSSPDGMLYSQCLGLGRIYRSHFERLTYSLQVGLQSIGKLKFVEIKSLFSNSSKEYKEIV